MATHSRILVGKSQEQRSLVGYSPWGRGVRLTLSMRARAFTLLPRKLHEDGDHITCRVFVLFNCDYFGSLGLASPGRGWRGRASLAAERRLQARGFRRCGTGRHSGCRPGPGARAQQLWVSGFVAPQHVGSSWSRGRTGVPRIGRWVFNHGATREVRSSISEKQIIPRRSH